MPSRQSLTTDLIFFKDCATYLSTRSFLRPSTFAPRFLHSSRSSQSRISPKFMILPQKKTIESSKIVTSCCCSASRRNRKKPLIHPAPPHGVKGGNLPKVAHCATEWVVCVRSVWYFANRQNKDSLTTRIQEGTPTNLRHTAPITTPEATTYFTKRVISTWKRGAMLYHVHREWVFWP